MPRVTTHGSTNAMVERLAAGSKAVAREQEKVTTGVRFDRASQSPAEAAIVLRNQRSLDRLVQLGR